MFGQLDKHETGCSANPTNDDQGVANARREEHRDNETDDADTEPRKAKPIPKFQARTHFTLGPDCPVSRQNPNHRSNYTNESASNSGEPRGGARGDRESRYHIA